MNRRRNKTAKSLSSLLFNKRLLARLQRAILASITLRLPLWRILWQFPFSSKEKWETIVRELTTLKLSIKVEIVLGEIMIGFSNS